MNDSALLSYISDAVERGESGKREAEYARAFLSSWQVEAVRTFTVFMIRMELRNRGGELFWNYRMSAEEDKAEVFFRTLVCQKDLPYVEYVSSTPQPEQLLLSWHGIESESSRTDKLAARVRFLESQLRADKPYSQLYKFGAGSLFVSLISLAFWAVTGIGAPFHPVFAVAVVPAALGVIAMAFLIRRDKKHKNIPEDIKKV